MKIPFQKLTIIFAIGILVRYSLLPAQNHGSFMVYLENDYFAATDENYTHGCGFSWISGDLAINQYHTPGLRFFFQFMHRFAPDLSIGNISIAIRQNIYTPRNISTPIPDPTDQPYAGITFLPLGFHIKNNKKLLNLEIDFGIVGPHSYAAQSQKEVHKLIQDRDPKGWTHQLSDEWILNVNLDYRWRAWQKNLPFHLQWDGFPEAEVGFGNMRIFFNSGVQFRLGWQLPANFGTYLVQPACECPLPHDNKRGSHTTRNWGIHIFLSLKGEAVGRDIFLDGNTFHASAHVKKRFFVGELQYGLAMQFRRIQFTYTFVRQTRTFVTQKKPHAYGGLTINFLL